jgi:trans-aconitate 2-methyltransferase
VTAPSYSFGDSQIASERLAVVARTFAPTTRALLESLRATPGRVLDLGCGPGHTTELLAALYPHATLAGIDLSEVFAAQARERVPIAEIVVGDVTAPLTGRYDLVYSRFLLSHLPDIEGTITAWCRTVAPGGSLVLEEPERIVATDPLFARYEQIVAAVVAVSGADMYAGTALAAYLTPEGFRRVVDDAIDPQVTAGSAAAMFWRNARAWDSRVHALATRAEIDDLVAQLQRRVDDPSLDAIEWGLRRLVLTRAAA